MMPREYEDERWHDIVDEERNGENKMEWENNWKSGSEESQDMRDKTREEDVAEKRRDSKNDRSTSRDTCWEEEL